LSSLSWLVPLPFTNTQHKQRCPRRASNPQSQETLKLAYALDRAGRSGWAAEFHGVILLRILEYWDRVSTSTYHSFVVQRNNSFVTCDIRTDFLINFTWNKCITTCTSNPNNNQTSRFQGENAKHVQR
jgi:hypothetical protein